MPTEPRFTMTPVHRNCFPLRRASHSQFEARREENQSVSSEVDVGGGSEARAVTGVPGTVLPGVARASA